jgi:5-methylcytosine-specific restriction endonuclease McrA
MHKDPVARAAYEKNYRELHRERHRANVAVQDRARHANRRAELYGAPGVIRTRDVRGILAVGACFYCGTQKRLTIDHVIPLHVGGPNTVANIVACCLPCNISKFRADRPGRWAQVADACIECGTSSRKHVAHGLCTACLGRAKYRKRKVS